MGDFKILGLPESRKVLASINRMSLLFGFSRREESADSSLLQGGDRESVLPERRLNLSARGRSGELVSIAEAKSIVSHIEDSLETILDVLEEMQTTASDSTTIESRYGTGEAAKKEEANLRDLNRSRLDEFSAEIAAIITDTKFAGERLFETNSRTFVLLVDVGSGDGYTVSIDSLSVKMLGVSKEDIDISSTDEATNTLAAVDAACTLVEKRLDILEDVKSRLAYHSHNPSIADYEDGYSRIVDERFAREQMDSLKVEIAREAGKAMLAQGTVSPRNVLRLVDTKAPESEARIYSISDAGSTEKHERVPQELTSSARFRFAHIQRIDGSSIEPFSGNNAG